MAYALVEFYAVFFATDWAFLLAISKQFVGYCGVEYQDRILFNMFGIICPICFGVFDSPIIYMVSPSFIPVPGPVPFAAGNFLFEFIFIFIFWRICNDFNDIIPVLIFALRGILEQSSQLFFSPTSKCSCLSCN